jgi:adenylate cyclase
LSNKTFWIEFIGDRSVKIEEGESILEASLKAGIHHYHDCGGRGECTTCRVVVYEGMEMLSEPNELENSLRDNISLPSDVRLACQTYVNNAPVKIHRVIRDEVDIELYLNKFAEESSNEIGSQKELALFFLDIRDFTPFIQTFLPFDVIHIMRRLFSLFRKCIEDNEGRIIETAGDGLYAVFGLNNNIKEATKQAIEAGQGIFEELQSFNEKYMTPHFHHSFSVGIGLHTGKVIVGNVGLGINNNLTAMGLAVNIASRLQAATKTLNNSFVISEEAFKNAELLSSEAPLAKINLKGVRGEFTVRLIGTEYPLLVKA